MKSSALQIEFRFCALALFVCRIVLGLIGVHRRLSAADSALEFDFDPIRVYLCVSVAKFSGA
jgi:hypothetical protein